MRSSPEILWTAVLVFDLTSLMRRELRIKVAHEPNRLGAEHLRQAYEIVLPVSSRLLRQSVAEQDNVTADPPPQQQKTRRSRA